MAELIHTFTSGKMNKDLDERLVPNGEYRDALNLEVSTSDGSDVGSLQTLPGNSERVNRTYNKVTKKHTTWATYGLSNYIQDTAVCVGIKKDPTTEKIYWFIADAENNVSAIAEYDQVNDVVFPVLVDKNGILNFSMDYFITGINIMEGFLFWTDNQKEPKKIEISKFKAGSVDFNTHTQVHSADFTEEYVTVIKKYPLAAPTIYKKDTVRDGEVNTTTIFQFAEVDPEDPANPIIIDFGEQVTLTFFDAVDYEVGDYLLLKGDDETTDFIESYQVRVKVEEITTDFIAVVSIQQAGIDLPTEAVPWTVELEQEDPLFEFKFPRIATRFKYDDNQFSAFSPFSQIVFIPGEPFEYNGADGYNLAMTNTVRVLEVRDFVPTNIPKDVIAVDILYRDSANANTYKIDTIEKDSEQWNDISYYEPGDTQIGSGRLKIESELISSVLPANQILRPYDNVPKRALAQEITGNRLVYGNYVQNFNMVDYANKEVIPHFDFSISHDPTKNPEILEGETDPIPGVAIPSLKSMRTYQMGVVYLDEYGRQTPVFTNDSGGRSLNKEFASLYNTINVKLTNNPPNFAKYYKYYIKETSLPYYNLALDRFYLTEEDDVWLSFPSSDRNKVDEETFLELKKQHDNDTFVYEKARYKILSIENEAPESIKVTNRILGSTVTDFGNVVANIPGEDRNFFRVPTGDYEPSLTDLQLKDNLKVKISNASGTTVFLEVADIYPDGGEYEFALAEPIGSTISFFSQGDTAAVALFQAENKNKPEFEGRFFVKVYRDNALNENLLKNSLSEQFVVIEAESAHSISGSGRSSWWVNGDYDWFWDNVTPNAIKNDDLKYRTGNPLNFPTTGAGIEVGSQRLALSYHNWGARQGKAFFDHLGIWWGFSSGFPNQQGYNGFVNLLDATGSRFRFTDDPDKDLDSHVYTITNVYRSAYTVDDRSTGKTGSGRNPSSRVVRWNITVDKPIAWIPQATPTPVGGSPSLSGIEFVEAFVDPDTFTSKNPAIFETYPKEATDLEIYNAASDIYAVQNPGTSTASHNPNSIKLDWFNCYSFGQGVESNRIRDDFNQPIITNGPIASAVLDEAYGEELRATSLIWSQIFNSISSVNRLNQFIAAEPITKELNPYYTSIQKLHSRDTDLVTLCEDKILRVLANKDALFNADGSTNVVSNTSVLGQAVPFVGEYGISKNPESFASYGFRAYFTDKNRGVVMRLSRDGLTEISAANMGDFFADNLSSSTKLIGSYDDDRNAYNLTLDNLTQEWQSKLKLNYANPSLSETGTTVSFKEDTRGWTARKDFILESGISLNNKYYTIKNGKIWEHGDETVPRNNFYGVQYDSSVKFLINEMPASVKNFKTLNYSGTESREYRYKAQGQPDAVTYSLAEIKANKFTPIESIKTTGWYSPSISTDLQTGLVKEFLDKEGKYFNYIKGDNTEFVSNTNNNLDSKEFSMQGIGRPTSVTGDIAVDYTVSITMNSSCVGDNVTFTTASFVAQEGSNLQDYPDSVVTIIANNGYEIVNPVASSPLPSEVESVTFTPDGDNYIMTVVWADFVMPSNDLNIEICTAKELGEEVEFTLDAILRITEDGNVTPTSGDTPIAQISGVFDSSSALATQAVVVTVADQDDFYFDTTPVIFVNTGDSNNYSFSEYGYTYNPAGLLIGVSFDITYTFPAENITGDIIEIVANTKAASIQPAIPISYRTNVKDIACPGETRFISFTGQSGTVLNLVLDNGATFLENGLSTYALTMPASHTAGLNIVFPDSGSSEVTYSVTINEGGGLADVGSQPNPIVLTQCPGSGSGAFLFGITLSTSYISAAAACANGVYELSGVYVTNDTVIASNIVYTDSDRTIPFVSTDSDRWWKVNYGLNGTSIRIDNNGVILEAVTCS